MLGGENESERENLHLQLRGTFSIPVCANFFYFLCTDKLTTLRTHSLVRKDSLVIVKSS